MGSPGREAEPAGGGLPEPRVPGSPLHAGSRAGLGATASCGAAPLPCLRKRCGRPAAAESGREDGKGPPPPTMSSHLDSHGAPSRPTQGHTSATP